MMAGLPDINLDALGGILMGMAIQVVKEDLDKEWYDLIQLARDMGISLEEVRMFIRQDSDYYIEN